MPLYEDQCQLCGHLHESIRPFRDAQKSPACPKCKGPSAKLISCPSMAIVPGGTFAGKNSRSFARIGDWPDDNEWVDQG